MAGLAGQHSSWLAEELPHVSVPLPVPFILDPAAGGTVGTGLTGWGKGEEMGDVAWEGLMQKDFLPRGINSTECMFAFICILKHILKAPHLKVLVFTPSSYRREEIIHN